MKWQPDGLTARTREDGKYTVNRAPQDGWPATFMLVRLADKKILGVLSAQDELDYKARIRLMMQKCDA